MNRILVALDVDSRGRAPCALADTLRGAVGRLQDRQAALHRRRARRSCAPSPRAATACFSTSSSTTSPTPWPAPSRSAVATGAWMVNVHASGGSAMMRGRGAGGPRRPRRTGAARPLVIGVTVLTSLDEAALAEVGRRGRCSIRSCTSPRLAQDAGLDGVVASPQEIAAIRAACGPDFRIVTPGIRPAGPGRQGRSGANDDAGRGRRRGRVLPGDRPADHGRCRSASRRRGDRRRDASAQASSRRPSSAQATASPRPRPPGLSEKRKGRPREGPAWFRLSVPDVPRLLRGEDEVTAAILLPAGLVRLGAERRFLALGDDGDAIGGDTEADQVGLDGVGAAIAERQVVFGGAALVAVPFDVDPRAGPPLQLVGVLRAGSPARRREWSTHRDRRRHRPADARRSAARASSWRRSPPR